MQKVIYFDEVDDYSDYIDQSIIDYINEGQIETFESFDTFDLIAFDWYDLKSTDTAPAQILIYLDADDIFYICENEISYTVCKKLFARGETNEQAMYLFFRNLFKGSGEYLEKIENRISTLDDSVSNGIKSGQKEDISAVRYEVLHIKKYFSQLEFLFDNICDNDNGLISQSCLKYFEILHNRSLRVISELTALREYITQVKESYLDQIGIEQNDLMKVFTMVTSIFLPLTLIAGWYGMNIKMPEFGWKFGYPFVIILSLVVCALWLILFKKKKWL